MVAPELTADDPHVEPFATAPPDVVYISGFEQGVLVAPSGGTITGAGFSVTATNPRSGNYCLHLVAPASTAETIQYSQFPSWPNVRARVGIKVSARPAAGSAVLFAVINSTAGTLAQVTVSSAGVLSLQCGSGTVQAGPTIDTTSWHYVELQLTGVASATCDWKVDGVAQTRATGTITVGGNTGLLLGQAGTTGPAFTCDYDDIIVGPWITAATDWYGNGQILAQQPGSDGTHATVADFSPGDAGTLYSGTVTNAWTQVVKTTPWSTTRSTTSCLGMRVVNTNAYLEILPAPTTVSGVSANAVQPWISYSSSGTGANAAAVTAYNSALGTTGSLQGTVGGVLAAFNVTTNTIKCSSVPILRPVAGWTPAEVNAVRIRFGGGTSSDISPVPTVQALMLEVDWPVATTFVFASTPPGGQSNTVPAGVVANDLLLSMIYVEPINEGTASATFGVITPPAGWTVLPVCPVESNAAHITTNNDSRAYVAYKWAAGTESGTTATWTFGTDYEENNGVIVIRGARDVNGGHSTTPYLASSTASYSATDHAGATTNLYPAVSFDTTAIGPTVQVFIGNDWDSAQATLAGWSYCGSNFNTATSLSKIQPYGGPTGNVQPQLTAAHSFLTSILLAFGVPVPTAGLLPSQHHRRPAAVPARRDTRPSRAHF